MKSSDLAKANGLLKRFDELHSVLEDLNNTDPYEKPLLRLSQVFLGIDGELDAAIRKTIASQIEQLKADAATIGFELSKRERDRSRLQVGLNMASSLYNA